MIKQSTDPRILELLQLAAEEGIILPLPPEQIIALEDNGYTVDLRTGETVDTNEDRFTPTPDVMGIRL